MTDKEIDETPVKDQQKENKQPDSTPREIGGREGPEPTRYGDWENGGIISDF